MRRILFALMFGSVFSGQVQAVCVCRCVDGEMQPLCSSSSIDLPPICPMTACPMAPPSVAPIRPMQITPLGASQCSQQQVMNPATRQYEWRRVCS